ncbi:MAG: DNA gyrase subunit A [Candidatus Methanomethylophilaceae archaeon]
MCDIMERLTDQSIEEEMQRSYIDYAMSVIAGRALPDARDGLKPVHRRILYAMHDMGLHYNRPHKKCARVVGDVLGKYHPHGDQAAYSTLVRLAQDFSMRYPLVDGQGNFGSIDGDSAAAMRYTECRLSRIAGDLLLDLDKGTVPFVDNFDGSLQEPSVLPSRYPNLLVNGSSGIAVGMATNIPPHNLSEVVDALVLMLEDPEAELADLMEHIRGPDFPTGGTIYGVNGIISAYRTGRGKVRVRANTHIETMDNGRQRIIVTEIPYAVNKSSLVESIANLVKEKRIEGISDLRDESDRNGMRIVVELSRDAMEEVVLNQLFKHTSMETTFGIINLALVDNKPVLMDLKTMLNHYLNHRQEVVTKRAEFDLQQARKRHHILEGLMRALDDLDRTIETIRESPNPESAREALMAQLSLSEEQAKAILDMRLQKLTGIEMESLREEYRTVTATILDLEDVLARVERRRDIIREELLDMKESYGDRRRTQINLQDIDLEAEDLIPREDLAIIITQDSYIKSMPLDTYRAQGRGGRGLMHMGTKEEDQTVDMFACSTHDYVLFLTSTGRLHWLKGYNIPSGGRHARGKPMVNLLSDLEPGEKVVNTIPVDSFPEDRFLVFCTRNGVVKKTGLDAYKNVRVRGIKAIRLDEGDELVATRLTDGDQQLVMATRLGQAVRFDEGEVRSTGRDTRGVRGISLRPGDAVVSMAVVSEDDDLLSITENGYGKITPISDYRHTHRGSKGVITIKVNERNGPVVAVRRVDKQEDLMVMNNEGKVIRLNLGEIRNTSRNTMGVRIMRLAPGEKVAAVVPVPPAPPQEE